MVFGGERVESGNLGEEKGFPVVRRGNALQGFDLQLFIARGWSVMR